MNRAYSMRSSVSDPTSTVSTRSAPRTHRVPRDDARRTRSPPTTVDLLAAEGSLRLRRRRAPSTVLARRIASGGSFEQTGSERRDRGLEVERFAEVGYPHQVVDEPDRGADPGAGVARRVLAQVSGD